MGRETKAKKIGNYEYTCTQFPTKKSSRLFVKVSRIIGQPIGTMIAGFDPKKKILEQNFQKLNIGQAVKLFTSELGDDGLYDFCLEVCESVVVKVPKGEIGGQLKETVFDQHFSGRDGLARMLKVTYFALEVNYGNFLDEFAGGANLSHLRAMSTSEV